MLENANNVSFIWIRKVTLNAQNVTTLYLDATWISGKSNFLSNKLDYTHTIHAKFVHTNIVWPVRIHCKYTDLVKKNHIFVINVKKSHKA